VKYIVLTKVTTLCKVRSMVFVVMQSNCA